MCTSRSSTCSCNIYSIPYLTLLLSCCLHRHHRNTPSANRFYSPFSSPHALLCALAVILTASPYGGRHSFSAPPNTPISFNSCLKTLPLLSLQDCTGFIPMRGLFSCTLFSTCAADDLLNGDMQWAAGFHLEKCATGAEMKDWFKSFRFEPKHF